MKTLNSTIKYQLFLSLFFLSQIIQAQDFDDDVDDVPINDWIIPMAIIGLLLVFYYYKNKKLKY